MEARELARSWEYAQTSSRLSSLCGEDVDADGHPISVSGETSIFLNQYIKSIQSKDRKCYDDRELGRIQDNKRGAQ
jgi:hypothetical protein